MTEQLEVRGRDDATDAITAPGSAPDENGPSGYRYPGSPPFADTEIDRLVFRGRRKEIDIVLHSILSVDLFLVYAVSGAGKTSLLTAGVLEPLRERGYFPVIVRLNDPSRSPVALIEAQIRDAAAKAANVSVSRCPSMRDKDPSTLWELFGGLEIWRGNDLQHLVVIFDQFEELFTLNWDRQQRDQFIEQLGQVLRHHLTVSDQPEPADTLLPPDVKITIIIREDSLGELEALAQDVPQIMRHRFRLDGLSYDQAKAAICEPALVNDPRLRTQRFAYSDAAAEAILDFLQANEAREKRGLKQAIDPSQLQIICQHVERSILASKGAPPDEGAVVEVTENDLGGKEGLERVLRDFYRNELARFASNDRKLVRHLCESGLINQRGRRLSLEEGEIHSEYKVTKPMLEQLVDRRLLRAEHRVGSIYYELAHDTLAAPIVAYRDEARAARRRRWQLALGALIAVGVVIGLVAAYRHANTRALSAADRHIIKIDTDTSIDGTLSEANDDVTYEFTLPKGETRAVEIRPNDSSLNVYIAVSYPAGQFETADNGIEGEPEHLVLTDTSKGQYRLVVSGYSSGDFRLSFAPIESLGAGVSAEQTIGGADSQFRAFVLDKSDTAPLAFEVIPDGNVDVTVEVTGPNGQTEVARDAPAGGTEHLLLTDSSPGQYRLVITGDSEGTARVVSLPIKTLSVDAPVRDEITQVDNFRAYTFDVVDDTPLAVEVTPDSKMVVALDVSSTELGTVQQAQPTEEGDVARVVLSGSMPGRYHVGVWGSAAGRFRVALVPMDILAIGATTSGEIRRASDSEEFVFDGEDGTPVFISVVPHDRLDAVLDVTDESDFVQTVNGDDPTATEEFFVNTDGRFRLEVSGANETTGGFDIMARRADVEPIGLDSGVQGSIDKVGAAKIFEFEAVDDNPLAVSVVPSSGFDVMLEVMGPGDFWQQSDNGGNGDAETVSVGNPIAGRYQVVVNGFEGGTGGFQLSVAGSQLQPLEYGQPLQGSLTPTATVAVYEFEAPPNQSTTVEVVPREGNELWLEVVGPDGFEEFSDNAGTEFLIFEDPGRYRVLVSAYGTTGRFTVTARKTEPSDRLESDAVIAG